LTLTDTRQLATDWFVNEFPEDTVILREGYTILPQVLYLHDNWPYKWINLNEEAPSRREVNHYLSDKAQVIAVSNYIYERVRRDPVEEQARPKQLAYLEEKAELVKIFDPYRDNYQPDWFYLDQLYGPSAETFQRITPGPLIKIYRLPYENQPFSTEMPDISVPVNANFADRLILLGYDLPVRRAEPGEMFPITLYWQAVTRMDHTFVIFNHLLDEQQRNWGGHDRWPRETANTILWHPGEVVIDAFGLRVADDAPDGVYTIDIGLYVQDDPAANPLPLVREGRILDQSSVQLGIVKVGGAPPELSLSPDELNPEVELQLKLGEPPLVLLHGYDIVIETGVLKLTLYWESLAQTSVDYTTFVHLRDRAGNTVAQGDRPAGGGRYPTSLWDVGEIIRDEVTIPLTGLSGSEGSLFVGLYDVETGIRLTVPGNSANEIRLDVLPF
jgi:hypothetical protein